MTCWSVIRLGAVNLGKPAQQPTLVRCSLIGPPRCFPCAARFAARPCEGGPFHREVGGWPRAAQWRNGGPRWVSQKRKASREPVNSQGTAFTVVAELVT